MTLRQDVAYALRQLRANPGFAAAAVLSLALGIGANLAIYQVLDAVLFRELPVRDPGGLVQVQLLEGNDPQRVSYPLFREMTAHQQVLNGLFAVSDVALPTPSGAKGLLASGAYFRTLGIAARLGRTFTEDDDRPGAPAVAVISDAMWQRDFGRNPAAIGQTLELNGARATILGVAPRGFSGETLGASRDFWVPMSLQPLVTPGDRLNGAAYSWLSMLGRLRPGVTTRQAAAALDPIFRQSVHLTVTRFGKDYRIAVAPAARGLGDLDRRFERPLWLLMGMAGLVLAMLCGNLANLLLSRGMARTHEIGVRLALGAGRGRIVRQLLTESLVVAALGVALAVPLAARGAAALVALASVGSGLRLQTDWRQALFALVTAVVCTCLFGLAPTIGATRVDVLGTLQASRRTSTGGRRVLGKSLAVAQISMSLVLVSGAALFARSLWNLRHQDFGMRSDAVLIDLPLELTRPAIARQTALVWPLYERMNALPGVRSAAVSAFGPMSSIIRTVGASTPDRPAQRSDLTRLVCVSQRYFETMGISIVAGRGITETDHAGAPPAGVLNESAARALFGGANPIGRMVSPSDHYDAKSAVQIVGVARDVRFSGARDGFGFVVYVPIAQSPAPATSIVIAGNPALARTAIHEAAPDLMVGAIHTFGEAFDAGLGNDKLLAVIAGAFGLLALALSYVGVYGVLSYATECRTREIGIRVALGAGRASVYRMVFGEAGLLALASLTIGGVGAIAATRALRSMLVGFAAADYTLPLLAAALLCAVAAAASYLPARRAARVDPMKALRQE
jgi:predicted permease